MGTVAGYLGKVTVVATGEKTVLEMATWALSGAETDMMEDTSFTEAYKGFVPGQTDGGIVTVSGNYDPTDDDAAEGQGHVLIQWAAKAALDTLKCYYSGTGYWGLFGGTGDAYVQSVEVGTDQTGLATFSFVVKLSGGYFAKLN